MLGTSTGSLISAYIATCGVEGSTDRIIDVIVNNKLNSLAPETVIIKPELKKELIDELKEGMTCWCKDNISHITHRDYQQIQVFIAVLVLHLLIWLLLFFFCEGGLCKILSILVCTTSQCHCNMEPFAIITFDRNIFYLIICSLVRHTVFYLTSIYFDFTPSCFDLKAP